MQTNSPSAAIFRGRTTEIVLLVIIAAYFSIHLYGWLNNATLTIRFKPDSNGKTQYFFDIGYGFNETDSVTRNILADHTIDLKIDLPHSAGNVIRFDPNNHTGDIQISEIKLRKRFHFRNHSISPDQIDHIDNATRVSSSVGLLSIVAHTDDPSIYININNARPGGISIVFRVCLIVFISVMLSTAIVATSSVMMNKTPASLRSVFEREFTALRLLFPTSFRCNETALLLTILGFALLVNVTGIQWGLPGKTLWAPDELKPSDYTYAIKKDFSHGWHTRYPPLHYKIVASVYKPVIDWIDPTPRQWSELQFYSNFYLIGRGINIVFSVGILLLVYLVSKILFSPSTALTLTFLGVWVVPISYYSKIGNLDIPYVFWFFIAFFFYIRYQKAPSALQHIIYTVASVLSVASKDQAYGLFILPTLFMMAKSIHRHHASGKSIVANLFSIENLSVVFVFILTFILAFDLPGNKLGFVQHLKLIAGDASEPYRIFQRSFSGEVLMAGSSLVTIIYSVGLVTFSLCIVACLNKQRFLKILPILLPAGSYYICFMAVIGYNYLRFFLPVSLLILIASGFTLEIIKLQWKPSLRILLLTLAALPGIYLTLTINNGMLHDNRLQIESFFRITALKEGSVTLFEPSAYAIRTTAIPQKIVAQKTMKLEKITLNTRYVVINPDDWNKENPGNSLSDFMTSQNYRKMLSFPGMNESLFLNWLPVYSNLDKISPPLAVFEKLQ